MSQLNELNELKHLLRKQLADKMDTGSSGRVPMYIYQVDQLENFMVQVFYRGSIYGEKKTLSKVRTLISNIGKK